MKIRKFFHKLFLVLAVVLLLATGLRLSALVRGPGEVRRMRKEEVVQQEEGYQEYYFNLLSEDEKRGYRELLKGVRNREESFYLTISGDSQVDRVYHAVLKDHPELFWIHNRKQVYKTVYARGDYCRFSPEYSYSPEESKLIEDSMEQAYGEVLSLIPEGAGDYEKVQTVYTYIIDHTKYVSSEDDQSIAGVFWKKEAVCAGYAKAVQYLLERLGVSCIYVEGSSADSDEGHAWNLVLLDGEYYYVDATNGDQPDFLEGDAAVMAEHKTTIYDYLCPFPEEYEADYTASSEFPVPLCTARDKNFYVMNGACFDSYDREQVYRLCRLRLDNGAAVVRFKFAEQEGFRQACEDLIDNDRIAEIARYYMEIYGLGQVSYHYGILENLKTMYFMF